MGGASELEQGIRLGVRPSTRNEKAREKAREVTVEATVVQQASSLSRPVSKQNFYSIVAAEGQLNHKLPVTTLLFHYRCFCRAEVASSSRPF